MPLTYHKKCIRKECPSPCRRALPPLISHLFHHGFLAVCIIFYNLAVFGLDYKKRFKIYVPLLNTGWDNYKVAMFFQCTELATCVLLYVVWYSVVSWNFFQQPLIKRRALPVTTSAQVMSNYEMKTKFRQNVAQTICQRLKYYLHIKKITCHVSYSCY